VDPGERVVTAAGIDVVVVGAGLMGAATAWELTRRGRSVALVEAYEIGHAHGSSHGSSRIFRRAYPDPLYVGMTGRAREAWRELELDTGTALLTQTGGLDHGRHRDPEAMAAALQAEGVPCEVLTPGAASERWPQMRFAGPVLYHPEAGVVDADATVAACVAAAVDRGAQVFTGTTVEGAAQRDGRVEVRTSGPTLTADRLVVAAGAWLPHLAGALGVPLPLPELTVSQQQVFHFRQRDAAERWPIFVHKHDLNTFGLPSGTDGGGLPAIKLGEHDGGTRTTALARSGVVDPSARARMIAHVGRWLPGLDPEPVGQVTCLYTTTPDDDFVLDRVGPVVVASPCSGHGAKFAPLIGAMAADLALGVGEPEPRFRLRSPTMAV
jgi:monomeric sarcosine oxidase